MGQIIKVLKGGRSYVIAIGDRAYERGHLNVARWQDTRPLEPHERLEPTLPPPILHRRGMKFDTKNELIAVRDEVTSKTFFLVRTMENHITDSALSVRYLTTLTPQHELKTALWRETWLNNRPGTDPKYGLQGRKAKSFREFTGWLPEADLDELVIARNLRFSGKGVLSPPSFAVLKDCKWPHNVGPYTTADESGEEDEPASGDDAGG